MAEDVLHVQAGASVFCQSVGYNVSLLMSVGDTLAMCDTPGEVFVDTYHF